MASGTPSRQQAYRNVNTQMLWYRLGIYPERRHANRRIETWPGSGKASGLQVIRNTVTPTGV